MSPWCHGVPRASGTRWQSIPIWRAGDEYRLTLYVNGLASCNPPTTPRHYHHHPLPHKHTFLPHTRSNIITFHPLLFSHTLSDAIISHSLTHSLYFHAAAKKKKRERERHREQGSESYSRCSPVFMIEMSMLLILRSVPFFFFFFSPPIKGFSVTQIEAPRREVDTCSSSVDLSVRGKKLWLWAV